MRQEIPTTARGYLSVADGRIVKALSGFYYVAADDELVRCRARGKLRHSGESPLVGDLVSFTRTGSGEGVVDAMRPRRNAFTRPPVANMDQMVIVASQAIPVTDPFLIDRMTAIAVNAGTEVLICLNKADVDPARELLETYIRAGFRTIRTSAVTGEGLDRLNEELIGKFSVFTGNSGVGKSSILNVLAPGLAIPTGEVSRKLGRGRHTTRHVEIFSTPGGAMIADTPGFAAFDLERMELTDPEKLQYAFPDFAPYIGSCRFAGCSHTKERGCSLLEALRDGKIASSRHASYVRLYEQLKSVNEWERRGPKERG